MADGGDSKELVFDNVSRRYGRVVAIDGVSFSVSHGEIVAILGPSGSGKTTLLSMVGGQLPPDSGDIRIGGKSILGLPPNKIDAATVFQDYALFPHLSVIENVAFGLRVAGVARVTAQTKALEVLSLVGLQELADRRVTQISGGQRQRVATARALAVEPAVLLMDEPLGALDRQIRIRLQEELSELLRRLKVTTLLVTHDQTEAFAMANRIAVMRLGRLEQIDTPSTLYRWPRTQFVATFLGGGSIIQAKILSSCDEASVFADLDGSRFRCRVRGKPAEGSSLNVLIRPEHIALVPSGSVADVTLRNGRVQRIVERGDVTRLRVQFGEVSLESIHLGLRHFAEGAIVDAIVDPDGPVAIQEML
jgi:ABC-type Fe3+/spermidine/putrescine transport system ATPase subunit